MDDILIIVLLILVNGIFSMSEIALISARKTRLAADAKQGSRGACIALKLAEDPDRFLSTIQIGITLIGILTGLYSGAALAQDVGALFQKWGLEAKTAHNIAQITIVAIVTYLSIVVGELVPKRIGLAAANTVAKAISRPMQLLSIVTLPAVRLLSLSTSLLVKILGIDRNKNNVTEEEIKSLIQDGADAGEVRKVEQDIMERALVLGDLRVSSIMTPKVDITTLNLSMTVDDVRKTLSDELHNSYPVYCDSQCKTICGIVSLKQLILTIDKPGFTLSDVIISPEYFPESMSVYDALDRMKNKNVHFAIICDEFGDMTGVITPSDILEGLVGTLPQQSSEPNITPGNKTGEWIVDARIQFYEFLNNFGLEDYYHPAPYSTLGGFILEELKHVPEAGEKFTWNSITFIITAMDGVKIDKVSVLIPASPTRN